MRPNLVISYVRDQNVALDLYTIAMAQQSFHYFLYKPHSQKYKMPYMAFRKALSPYFLDCTNTFNFLRMIDEFQQYVRPRYCNEAT